MRYTLFIALLLTGCSASNAIRYETAEEALTRGQEAFAEEDYIDAAAYLNGVFDFGRTHQYAPDAQLMLARTRVELGEFVLAEADYQRFTQLYRADPRVPLAEFELATVFEKQSPQYQLDQTKTERAIDAYRLFIARYPDHEKASDAEQRITALRGKLARKHLASGALYERREMYEAAALTYLGVFDRYPDTEWADDALLGGMRNYKLFADLSIPSKQRERYELAITQFDRLVSVFRDSELIPEATRLLRSVEVAMEGIDTQGDASAGAADTAMAPDAASGASM